MALIRAKTLTGDITVEIQQELRPLSAPRMQALYDGRLGEHQLALKLGFSRTGGYVHPQRGLVNEYRLRVD